ncbi:hypothetical protein [Xenophilus azovorans]|uniref:hypothetical protein n=1 Tax=Xenophilus azovorans TaxID=151755 RepID=UPI0012ED8339|nr:hypothetical protein [Xenophilus azovorans]
MNIDRIFNHIFSPFLGNLFDDELIKDYWIGADEPWNENAVVRFRFLKLLYIYIASATIQCILPCGIMLMIPEIYRKLIDGEFSFSHGVWFLMGWVFLFIYLVALGVAVFKFSKIEFFKK